MCDNKEFSDQLTDTVSSSTMALPDTSLKKSQSKENSSQQQLDSQLDLVAHNETDGKPSSTHKIKKRVMEVSEINENLIKSLDVKNKEIVELKTSVQCMSLVLNTVPDDELHCNSSLTNVKISDLSNKNRQLRAELEIIKNRLAKRENQIQTLKEELKQAEEQPEKPEPVQKNFKPNTMNALQTELKIWRRRFFLVRNKNLTLKNEVKMAQRCLQKEVGSNVDIQACLSNSTPNTWRGRAQQILNLQQKIYELKKCLEGKQDEARLNNAEKSITDKLKEQKLEFERDHKEITRQLEFVSLERDMAMERERNAVMNLQTRSMELQNRERVIDGQNQQIERLKDDLRAVCGDYLFACRDLRKEEFIAILDSLECDKKGLLEHVRTLQTRLEQEREKHGILAETISKQKACIAAAEERIKELEKDLAKLKQRSPSSGVHTTSFIFGKSHAKACQEVSDLKDQIEFANEKISILEEKVTYLNKEKNEDYIAFEQYIGNSKQIILDKIVGKILPGARDDSSCSAVSSTELTSVRRYDDDESD